MVKYVGINLAKIMWDLYNKNYKAFMKEIGEEANEKIPMFMDQKDYH